MNHISYYPNIFTNDVRGVSKEEEMEIRNSDAVRRSVDAVRRGLRDAKERKKYNYWRLVNGCPSGDADDGTRLLESLEPTGKVILDYDVHGGWQRAWKVFKRHLDEWGVLHFERSASLGAHITVRRMEGLSLEENITLFEARTGLTFDYACKNLSRAIFLVPMDDVLYVHDDYYETHVTPMPLTPEGEQVREQSRITEGENAMRLAEIEHSCSVYDYTDDDETKLISIIEDIAQQGIDITSDYHDWIRLGFVCANHLGGKAGLSAFITLSKFHPEFDYRQTTKVYDYLCRTTREEVHIGSLIYIARKNGWQG